MDINKINEILRNDDDIVKHLREKLDRLVMLNPETTVTEKKLHRDQISARITAIKAAKQQSNRRFNEEIKHCETMIDAIDFEIANLSIQTAEDQP